MSLLTIVQDAALLVGLSPPASVASSNDPTNRLLLLLATRAGKDIAAFHDWSGLAVSGDVTGDGATTSFALPTDLDRFAVGQRIIVDGGTGTIASGPLSPVQITSLRASGLQTVSNLFYRRGATLIITPALSTGRKALFEYQSKNWCISAADVSADHFISDDDTTVAFSEELVMLGVVWRFKQQKGLDYAQSYEDWRQRCHLVAARDGSLVEIAAGPAFDCLPEPTIGSIAIAGDDLELN